MDSGSGTPTVCLSRDIEAPSPFFLTPKPLTLNPHYLRISQKIVPKDGCEHGIFEGDLQPPFTSYVGGVQALVTIGVRLDSLETGFRA